MLRFLLLIKSLQNVRYFGLFIYWLIIAELIPEIKKYLIQ